VTTIYSARWVLPIAFPAIDFGAVAIQEARIAAVGTAAEIIARFPDARVEDFGQSVLLPGLINAHSHLELTVMRGFLEHEEPDFFAWLRKLTVARMGMTPEDLFVSAACGAVEAARAGITCLADSSSAAAQSMKALREVGLRAIVYQESFGPDPRLADENARKLAAQLAELRALESQLVRAGVSPHAPYTVSPRQLELISQLALAERLPLMMHAAESEAERVFMLEGAGPFAEGLKARGIDWAAPGISTIQHLQEHGVLETKPLLAHCITVDGADLELIRQNDARIAHCPKSNAKLRHGRAPFADFIAGGLKTGLGSDSVASNNNCDLIEEARFTTLSARLTPGSQAPVSAEQSLFAATLGGAQALGLEEQVGALVEGMQADLTVIGLEGAHQQPVDDPVSTLVFSCSGRDVRLTVVAGKEIFRDGVMLGVSEAELLGRLRLARSRFDQI